MNNKTGLGVDITLFFFCSFECLQNWAGAEIIPRVAFQYSKDPSARNKTLLSNNIFKPKLNILNTKYCLYLEFRRYPAPEATAMGVLGTYIKNSTVPSAQANLCPLRGIIHPGGKGKLEGK